jgi:hypothetical protein
MAPNLRRKLKFYVEAAKRLLATAKARDLSFFALFFADASSVFGLREDHDKYEIYLRLAKVGALAPYLADTVLFSPPYSADLSPSITFPLVMKPVRGARSVGIVGAYNEKVLRRFLQVRRGCYIGQHFKRDAFEIGVSYTRNPAGLPDFFGVAAKYPVRWTEEWNEGLCRLPKYFDYQDLTRNVDRERFIGLCRTIAETLRTNSFRFDAFVLQEGTNLKIETMRIIDVNIGIFAIDEFLFDPCHSAEFVIEELARKYTYLLLWGARHAPRPRPSKLRDLALHYIYCYFTLHYNFSDKPLMSKLRALTIAIQNLQLKFRHVRDPSSPL